MGRRAELAEIGCCYFTVRRQRINRADRAGAVEIDEKPPVQD